jgi:ADP-heptose:LPS heptosyltransferase
MIEIGRDLSMQVDFRAGARVVQAIRQDTYGPVSAFSASPWSILDDRNQADVETGGGSSLAPKYLGAAVYGGPKRFMANGDGIVPEVKKIAVLRSNGIGDFIFALPAFEALRRAYPSAEIVLLGLDWHAEFLEGRPGPVDRVVVVPYSQGVRNPPEGGEDPETLTHFFKRMEEEHFDLAIQMHGGGRYSNPFVKRLGARLTVGACTNDADPLDRWVPYQFYHFEILRFLEIASLVGCKPVEVEPRIHLIKRDLEDAADLIPEERKSLVILHPGAGDPRRRWPTEKFSSVAESLAAEGAQITITGSGDDCDLAETIVDGMSAPATNICGRISLGGLAALMSRADVVISNDSGPLHLARAVGAPTVGIYWIGNMINAGPVTRARHRTAISWRVDCPVCGLNCTRSSCEHRDSFVAEVAEAEVRSAASELIEAFGIHSRTPMLGET